MKIISLVNLKGGSAKTTSTVYLAHAFTQLGQRVLVVDSDPQGSALSWAETADFPFGVIGLPTRSLHKQVRGMDLDKYDIVLIDTPPLGEQGGIVHSALRASDLVIVTMAPTTMEYGHVDRVYEAMDEIAPVRQDGTPPPSRVLLNRTVANARSTLEMREALEDEDRPVFTAAIPRREAIGQGFGSAPKDLSAYLEAAQEVLDTYMSKKEAL